MTRPAPTSSRGLAKARARERGRAMSLDQAEARYLAGAAERVAAGEKAGVPWDEFAADSDAAAVHYGQRPIFAGAYTEEQFAAALDGYRQKAAVRDARMKKAPPMTPAQKAHVASFPKAGAPVAAKAVEPTDAELDAMSDSDYQEYLYREMLKVEKTPAAMAARLDRIDRQRVKTGQTRQWSDQYRASKGLPAFVSSKKAGTAGTDAELRAWVAAHKSQMPTSATDAELAQWIADRKGGLPPAIAAQFGRPLFTG